MNKFSEKSLMSLGEFYVYGLIDPRTDKIFYIGKGKGNRVFEHEIESLNSPYSDKLKLKTISEIKKEGLEVKIIINSNLTEDEAFASEAALINAFNYVFDIGLTNIVSGHHSSEALTVDDFEKINGAIELREEDVHHNILVIKVNKLYRRDMPIDELYDSVRGVWRLSLQKVQNIDYVFGVFNSLIVAVYKPSKWYVCKEATDKLPRQDLVLNPKTENRKFFVDENFENGLSLDENQQFYIGKSIVRLKVNQSSQNPVSYLYPKIKKYEVLTKYISAFSNDFQVKEKTKGLNQTLISNFIDDVYMFKDENKEMDLIHYERILQEHGFEWSMNSLMSANVSQLDDSAVMAVIIGMLRADYYCNGSLDTFISEGCIVNCLRRLYELDNQ